MQPGDMVQVKTRRGRNRHTYWQVVEILGAEAALERWSRGRHIESTAAVGDLLLIAGPSIFEEEERKANHG